MNEFDWFFWAVLSAVFAALTTILAKVGLEGVDSDLATAIRTAVILLILGMVVGISGKWRGWETLSSKASLFLVLSGLASCASWMCYYRALKLGKASQVAPVDKLSVVLVAIFAVVFLGERLSLREWSGIALVAAGLIVISFKR